jgi:hypothetical protein
VHLVGDDVAHHLLAAPGGLLCRISHLLLLRFRLRGCGALANDRLDARNVLAEPADLLQTFRLSHVHLELQLEELVGEIPLLMQELGIGLIANLFGFHKNSSQLPALNC